MPFLTWLWAMAANDLVYAAAILPLILIDFRMLMSSTITCNDASLEGAKIVEGASSAGGLGRQVPGAG